MAVGGCEGVRVGWVVWCRGGVVWVVWGVETNWSEAGITRGVWCWGGFDVEGRGVVGDYLSVNSGYAQLGQLKGNAMIVYRLPQAESAE